MAVVTLRPSGAGDSTLWSPSSALNWQDAGDASDLTYVYADTAGQKDLYQFDDLGSTTWTITAVILYIRYGGTAGTANDTLRFSCKHGGNEIQSVDFDVPAATTTKGYTFLTNPAGGSWLASEVQTAQFGFELTELDPTSLEMKVFDAWVDVTYTVPSGRILAGGADLNGLGGMGQMSWNPLG